MENTPQNPSEDRHSHPWKRYLTYMKWYALIMLGISLILAALGYSGAGWPGVLNGLTWGLMMGIFGLPILGLLLSVSIWSGYAHRWGEYNYKKQLEGDPDKKKEENQRD
ncbi:MAG: hypothetical protein PHT43_07145 [Anaerolineaceae bacterium]|jgi:predicted PurR-regulated permease PerM|nr:hypothetical protein [Anaerolineaceae bacterium]